jgi:hypothetical protein
MSKSSQNTTQTTKVELPAWVDKASQGNYEMAQQIANKPYVGYQGDRLANQSNMTTAGYDYLMRNVGATPPMYDDAYGMLQRAGTELDPEYDSIRAGYAGASDKFAPLYDEAYGMLRDSATPFNSETIQPYLNPWIDEVETNAIGNAEREITKQIAGNTDAARKASAFGGSRFGIQNAVTQAEGSRGIGDLSAILRKEGYDTAGKNFWANAGNLQQAAGGMMTGAGAQADDYLSALTSRAGLAGQQQKGWLDTAGGLTDTATKFQDSIYKDVAGMLGAGVSDEARRQQEIDSDMAAFDEANNYDLERLGILQSSLGQSPYGKTETTKKETKSDSGIDWATAILGGLKLIPGISDRRDKTDIVDLKEKNKLGLPMYAYRYKGDPKSYPKVVGPMAQDVEKKYPGVVKEVGGHKTVPMGILASA